MNFRTNDRRLTALNFILGKTYTRSTAIFPVAVLHQLKDLLGKYVLNPHAGELTAEQPRMVKLDLLDVEVNYFLSGEQ